MWSGLVRPHEKLDVWRFSVDLVVSLYECTKSFPDDERYRLTSQIRRAAVSIPTNIAEGAARQHDKEFIQSFPWPKVQPVRLRLSC